LLKKMRLVRAVVDVVVLNELRDGAGTEWAGVGCSSSCRASDGLVINLQRLFDVLDVSSMFLKTRAR
jgi:hypothetical protein